MAHHSASGAFYGTTDDAPHVILRLKDGMDTTLPSTNGIAASNLFRLGAMLGDDDYTALARETIHAFEVEMLQHPWLFPSLLSGVVAARLGGKSFLSSAQPGSPVVNPVLAQYFSQPRAGLRTLVYQSPGSGTSWLAGRSDTLRRFSHENTEQGCFILDDGAWRKCTDADVTGKSET